MKKYFLSPKLWLAALLAVGLVGCDSDDESSEQDIDPNAPVITEGMELESELLKDGEVIEKAVDKIVNFGTAEDPLLFAVNKSHEVNGKIVPEGATDVRCTFYTLTRGEYERFIPIYAQAANIASSNTLTPDERVAAFASLADYVKRLHIETAPLAYLMTNAKEAKAVMEIIEGVELAGSVGNPVRTVIETIIRKGMRASEFVNAAKAKHLTMANYFLKADMKGFSSKKYSDKFYATDIFILYNYGGFYRDRIEIPFIVDGKSEGSMYQRYAQLYHVDDLNVMHYYDTKKEISPTYECRYGGKNLPMAVARFHFRCYHNGKHETLPGINFLETSLQLEEVSHSWSMHCDGTIAYEAAQMRMEGDLPVGILESEVVIEYGDCCAVRRTGRVHYVVDGLTGFWQLSWDDNE